MTASRKSSNPRKSKKRPPSGSFEREFSDRLQRAVDENGFVASSLARELEQRWSGSKATTRISNYLAGHSRPLADTLRDMAEVLNVSIDWLTWGTGPMLRDQERAPRSLEEDLATHLCREITKAVNQANEGPLSVSDLRVNGNAVLALLVEKYVIDMREQIKYLEERRLAFQRARDHLHNLLARRTTTPNGTSAMRDVIGNLVDTEFQLFLHEPFTYHASLGSAVLTDDAKSRLMGSPTADTPPKPPKTGKPRR